MLHPVNVTAEYPEKLSRGILILRTLFGWLYVGIPHGVCLLGYGIAVFVVVIIAWFAVLFTGKYPKGLFDFVVGYIRWCTRVDGYLLFLTDKYPPFSNKE
ncbi:MAG: DUF4389 domain-containing protein [Bacteroidota bacterium]